MSVADAFEYLIRKKKTSCSTWIRSRVPLVERAEQMGIIFIDEIDKVAGRESGHGHDRSREGVPGGNTCPPSLR